MGTERGGSVRQRATRLVASGRVQGVGFRYFVVRAAQGCGAVGYVRNLDDGDVEIWAEGPGEALDRLEAEVRKGPRHAQVEALRRMDGEPTGSFRGFEVRF